MSGKRFRKLLLQSTELDEIVNGTSSSVQSSHKKKRKQGLVNKNNNSNQIQNAFTNSSKKDLEREKEKEILKKQIDSFLFYDHAFSRRSEITNQSKKRKMKELSMEENDKMMMKLLGMDSGGGTFSNSRSSSSRNSRNKHEPTFDKKKDAERKKIKNLQDLARQLKKKK